MERQEPKWKISIHAPPRGATLTIDDISTASIFQFTPLREGRRATVSTDRDDLVFQFTPLREGRRATATYQRDVFQFTPLREGRQHTKVGAYKAAIFQFTPLREGRRNWDGTSDLAIAFQFTPLREGRRTDALAAWLGGYFNSRPSARGDYRPACFCRRHAISIHAPPRGATNGCACRVVRRIFQFTPLREGRLIATMLFASDVISIHAPPRGATDDMGEGKGIWYISIHAPPRGATQYSWEHLAATLFQFTPLREGRPKPAESKYNTLWISIHAPPRGATPPLRCQVRLPAISIHAPPRGATRILIGRINQ